MRFKVNRRKQKNQKTFRFLLAFLFIFFVIWKYGMDPVIALCKYEESICLEEKYGARPIEK